MSGRDGSVLAAEEKAEIIDGIYDVAVDPTRYEALLAIWEKRLRALQMSNQSFSDPEIEQHAQRALLFLGRLDEANARSDISVALDEVGSTAAFISADGSTISSANPAASKLFDLDTGAKLAALPIEAEDALALGRAIRTVVSQASGRDALLRARSVRTGGPIAFRVRRIENAGDPAAIVVTSEFTWPEGLTETLREAFDLTIAEAEIVRAVTSGLSPKDIADTRGRSLDTVRTQIKHILAKTQTRSQSELVRVALGLMDIADSEAWLTQPPPAPSRLQHIPLSPITLSDGRRYTYIEFGDPNGFPVLYFPMSYGFVRWPICGENGAARRGLRIISVIRAGYGSSSPMPAGASYRERTAQDALELLRALGIGRAAIISLGNDLRHALQLAVLDPGRICGILGCSALLPIKTAEQFARMGRWHRIILSNARYAPRLLPFLIKAASSMATRLGKDRLIEAIHAGSPADLKALQDPQIRDAIVRGTDATLSDWHSAHDAFAREIVDGQSDWSGLIGACQVPVHLLQGGEDLQCPPATVRELLPLYPNLQVEFVESAGQLLFFQELPRALEKIEKIIASK